MEFSTLIQRVVAIREMYSQYEQRLYGSAWTNEEIALDLVGDIGDLVKLVMAQNGRRNIADAQEKLAHELADCLWSIIVLAEAHDVDLEQAFLETMDDLESHIKTSR
jgi:NTP pyrophosphatase (non-canonical NTP hydrolase)